MPRDRDETGRPRNARPRDTLGRPLPRGSGGATPDPEPVALPAADTLVVAQDLLDRGLPFRAHEVLEARWKSCPPAERDYWQGLAQAAVAVTHVRRGNTAGARRLAQRAAEHLSGQSAPPPGVAPDLIFSQLDALASGADAHLEIVIRT